MAAAASACGGAGCGPQCSSSAGGEGDASSESMGRLSISSAAAAAATCGKCDGGGAAVAVAGGVGMCVDCFRAHLFGKFKLAVTSNAMVRPTDAVLLAFSGGPASRSPSSPYFFPFIISRLSLYRVIWAGDFGKTLHSDERSIHSILKRKKDQCTRPTYIALASTYITIYKVMGGRIIF
jgi:hypothetical protein